MTTQLSSLRVSADFDATGYQRGADQKVAADKAMAASSRDAGSALARQDAASDNSGGVLGRLSRQFIDGYGNAAKFEAAVKSLQRGVEAGAIPMDRAGIILQGLHSKFGLLADAQRAAASGNAEFAAVIERTNLHLRSMSPIMDDVSTRAARLQEQFAAMTLAQAGLNSRLGVRDDFNTAARAADIDAYGQALTRLQSKYDPLFAAGQK